MTWIVREGRTTRYLYICRAEQDQHPKIAEVDLWAGTPADASLMAAAPRLLEAFKNLLDCMENNQTWDGYALEPNDPAILDAQAAIAAAETPFVQTYAKNVSKE